MDYEYTENMCTLIYFFWYSILISINYNYFPEELFYDMKSEGMLFWHGSYLIIIISLLYALIRNGTKYKHKLENKSIYKT